ncbi:MAG: hypothetical protein QMD85_00250 [Candidatus Aenigmarchaeota archaeon]|nr:hypothetical protein [Candidatus Aenigmarchaeota archaeon]MDI6721958.1 hypothetical protein [Candidatus Aenigmarchaeota archaeon]
MYHPGKILKVFSPKDADVKSHDGTTQALIEMWDENLFTFLVDPHIANDIREGDIVLVDYSPISPTNPAPKNLIMKILRGKNGEATWNRYKKFSEKRKAQRPQTQHQPQEYFG